MQTEFISDLNVYYVQECISFYRLNLHFPTAMNSYTLEVLSHLVTVLGARSQQIEK